MSTTASQRLAEIIRQVDPLGQKATGMPISADDWNALVGALVGFLRNEQLQEDSMETLLADRFARREHEHGGAVTFDWLDADLRARVGEGAVEMKGRLAAIEKKVDGLTARVQRLETRNERLQDSVDKFSVNDVDRTKALDTFRGRFEELTETNKRVRALGDDLTATKTNISDVLEFRQTLQNVDVSKLRDEVEGLKVLRDNLRGKDNQLVRLLDLQLKLDELEVAAGVGEGLNKRFLDLGVAIETNVRDVTKVDVGRMREELLADQGTRIRTAVGASTAELTTALMKSAESREKETEARLATTLGVSLLAEVRKDSEIRGKAVDLKLADVDVRIIGAVTGARGDIERAVRDSITPRIANDVSTAVTAAETRLGARVQRTETAFETFKAAVPDTVRANVRNETADLRESLTLLVRNDVGAVRTELLNAIPAATQTAAGAALGNLDIRIATAVNTQIGDLGTRVKREVETATRDLPVQVETLVSKQIEAADIAGTITAVTTPITNQLRNEIRETATKERTQTMTEINATKLQMRGEIAASSEVAKNAAVAETQTLVTMLRTDTDAKFKVVGTKANIPELTRPVRNPNIVDVGVFRPGGVQ